MLFIIKNSYQTDETTDFDHMACLIICFFLTFFPFLPTLNFFNNWINIIYYLPLGFYLYENYKNRDIVNQLN